MMTAARSIPGWRSSRRSSVVLPLPRNPVMTVTGSRLASGSTVVDVRALATDVTERHLEDVQAAGEAIDGIDDAALVDVDVVQLDRAGRRQRRRARHEVGDFLRLIRVADVVGAHAGIEEGADHDLVGAPRRGHRQVLVQVVRAEASAAVGERGMRRRRQGADRHEIASRRGHRRPTRAWANRRRRP